MSDISVYRPTWWLLAPWTLLMTLFALAGILGPDLTVAQRGVFVVVFGPLAVASMRAFGDRISFEGPVPTITTRRLGLIRTTFDVPPLLPKDFRVVNYLVFPVGVSRSIRIPGHRANLWMYAGRQQRIIDRLSTGPARSMGTSTSPTMGRVRRPPDEGVDR